MSSIAVVEMRDQASRIVPKLGFGIFLLKAAINLISVALIIHGWCYRMRSVVWTIGLIITLLQVVINWVLLFLS